MLHDNLADVLSSLKNSDKIGKKECITPASKMVRSVLEIFREKGYIKSFDFIEDGKSGKFKIELSGKIIDCNVIKPRFSVKVDGYEDWEKRFLPAREFGSLIVSTPKGVLDHKKARETGNGGKLLAFVY